MGSFVCLHRIMQDKNNECVTDLENKRAKVPICFFVRQLYITDLIFMPFSLFQNRLPRACSALHKGAQTVLDNRLTVFPIRGILL